MSTFWTLWLLGFVLSVAGYALSRKGEHETPPLLFFGGLLLSLVGCVLFISAIVVIN